MMKQETKQRIIELKKEFKDKFFTEKDLYRSKWYVSLSTLRKYDLIESIKLERKKEFTIDELIETVNSCIGDDLYGMKGEFRREGEKIFYVTTYHRFNFK